MNPATTPNRPRWQMALLTWIAVYPTLTILLGSLNPFLEALPLWLRTLLVTAIFVPLMVFVLMPLTIKIADAAQGRFHAFFTHLN